MLYKDEDNRNLNFNRFLFDLDTRISYAFIALVNIKITVIFFADNCKFPTYHYGFMVRTGLD